MVQKDTMSKSSQSCILDGDLLPPLSQMRISHSLCRPSSRCFFKLLGIVGINLTLWQLHEGNLYNSLWKHQNNFEHHANLRREQPHDSWLAQGFVNSRNQVYMLDTIRWISDFFIKCHHDDLAFTAGVGDPNTDHSLWERPEDISESRPAYDLTPNNPGGLQLPGSCLVKFSRFGRRVMATQKFFKCIWRAGFANKERSCCLLSLRTFEVSIDKAMHCKGSKLGDLTTEKLAHEFLCLQGLIFLDRSLPPLLLHPSSSKKAIQPTQPHLCSKPAAFGRKDFDIAHCKTLSFVEH